MPGFEFVAKISVECMEVNKELADSKKGMDKAKNAAKPRPCSDASSSSPALVFGLGFIFIGPDFPLMFCCT